VCHWAIVFTESNLFNESLDCWSSVDITVMVANSVSKQLQLVSITYFSIKRRGTKLLDFVLTAGPILLLARALISLGQPLRWWTLVAFAVYCWWYSCSLKLLEFNHAFREKRLQDLGAA
jgi:hypothetical protein